MTWLIYKSTELQEATSILIKLHLFVACSGNKVLGKKVLLHALQSNTSLEML